jgi:hypothetical protein
MIDKASATLPVPDTAHHFRQCIRDRLRLARELASLRARFAAVAEDYERVIRRMQVLAPSVGVSQRDIGHPTDPEWGPSALIAYADGRFLKNEQETNNRLLHRLP